MGMGTAVLVILGSMSFALYLLGFNTFFTALISGNLLSSPLYTQMIILLTVTVVGTVIASVFVFPNQYLIFSALTVFLLSFVTLPVELLASSDMPVGIKVFVGGMFGFMYLLAVLSWFKGGGEF